MLELIQSSQAVLRSEAIRTVFLALVSFLVAFLMTPFWAKVLARFQMKKQIRTADAAPVYHALHAKKSGTPTGGGIIIWSTVLILAGVLWILSYLFDGFWGTLSFINRAETYLPLAALAIAAAIGLLDDWFGVLKRGPNGGGLHVRHKLLLYAAIAAVGAWWFADKLDWTTLYVPFYGNIEIGGWYIPFFMFVVIATTFSANETDGLDGLFGGVALFVFCALTAVAFVLGRYDLAAFGGVVIGALLAFLWFNIYPARFFMGDTGSMSLGVTIAVISLLTNTALFLPLFGIILVIESGSVLIQLASKKLRGGKKIFRSTPIHHHFEALGWPESQVTMRFWIISAVASALGLALFFLSRLW